MDNDAALSTYLVKPNIQRFRRKRWNGFRAYTFSIHRGHPRVLSKTVIALALWGIFSWSFTYAIHPKQLPFQNNLSGSAARTDLPANLIPSSNATLASVAHISMLPGGPTGELLPPGTLAPDLTYPNSYARGQCTWYVAGRRNVPANWGNAAAWYYHAVASGWKVGTIPALGAIAWTPAGYYGHVALVEQISANHQSVYISEMNYRGIGIKSYRWVSASSFKYIY